MQPANAFCYDKSKMFLSCKTLHSLPNDKISDWSKLKAFADDKLDVVKVMISLFDRVEFTVGKGENLVTSIFSFSHSVFQSLLWGRKMWGLCGKELNALASHNNYSTSGYTGCF